MVKRLHWHVLRSFMGPFLASLSVLGFILVSQFIVMYLHKLTGTGIGPGTFLQLIWFTVGRILITAVPMAVLAGGIMTFGELGENNELIAARSSGCSLWSLMSPLVGFSLVLMTLMFFATLIFIPDANLRFQRLVYKLSQNLPEVAFRPGYFHTDMEGYVIWISDKNTSTGVLYDLMVYDHQQEPGNTNLTLADSAKSRVYPELGMLRLTLYNGARHEEYSYQDSTQTHNPHGRAYFDSLYLNFELQSLIKTSTDRLHHRNNLRYRKLRQTIDTFKVFMDRKQQAHMNTLGNENLIDSTWIASLRTGPKPGIKSDTFPFPPPQSLVDTQFSQRLDRMKMSIKSNHEYLQFMAQEREILTKQLIKYQFEYYTRFALPVNVVLFMLIGISLGSIVRKGGMGFPALGATFIFIIFYLAFSQAKKLTKISVLQPWEGAWLPVVIFIPIAGIITLLAVRESTLLQSSTWNDLISHIRNKFSIFVKTGQQSR